MTRRGALMEAFTGLGDRRKPGNGARHDFHEIPVMTMAALPSDCDAMQYHLPNQFERKDSPHCK
jgi:hypothetical protein